MYATLNLRIQNLRFRSNFDDDKWARPRASTRRWSRRSRHATAPRLAAILREHLRAEGRGRAATAYAPATTHRGVTHERAAAAAAASSIRRATRRSSRSACAAPCAGEVLFDRASRGRYSTDASIYQVEPIGVLVPRSARRTCARRSTSAASSACRCCRAARAARNAGRRSAPRWSSITASISNGIVAFDRDAMTVTVEPGVVLDALNAWLRPHGLWFPVDVSTSAQCTLGGMAGNNSCGSRSIAYGNMVHNVAAIDALLADGTAGALRAGARRWRGAPPRVRELVAAPARDRRARARRDRAPGAGRAAPRGRLQHRRVPPAKRAAVHGRRQRQPRAPAGRQRRHARVDARAHAQARAVAEASHARRRQLSRRCTARWNARGTSSRSRRPRWSSSTAR